LDFDYALEWLTVKLDKSSSALDFRSAVVGALRAQKQSENAATPGRRASRRSNFAGPHSPARRLAVSLLLIHHESATALPSRGLPLRDISRKNNDLNRIYRKYRHAKTQ
jgi:hypothetical protein